MKLFVGFKNAVEFYEDCRFWANDKLLTSYRQDELQWESFAYNSIKPRDAKASSKFSHSIWENVAQYSPSVCGCYIDLVDIADGQPHTFTIELTIPFTDQLALQAWQLYPNAICGEIEEEEKILLHAMVWCQVYPNIVKQTLEFLEVNFSQNSKLSKIGKEAFHRSNLKRISIPPNVTKINDGTFSFCRSLESIDIPENS